MVALQFSADSNYTGDVFQHVKRKTVFKSKNFSYIGHFFTKKFGRHWVAVLLSVSTTFCLLIILF